MRDPVAEILALFLTIKQMHDMTCLDDIGRLADKVPELERILTRGSVQAETSSRFSKSQIRREVVWVTMRDKVRLATDLYLPAVCPAPTIVVRTPYGRGQLAETFIAFAQSGYVVASQDCRGTGDSEPDYWDCYIYECEDSVDFVEWVTNQKWFDGFIGACGGSYLGITQWAMAMHPRMSAIAPEVASLLVTPINEPNSHLFTSAYSRSVGKGSDKLPIHYSELERLTLQETLAGGYFNEPLSVPFREALLERYPRLRTMPHSEGQCWLYEQFRTLGPAQRAELIKLALGEDSVTAHSLEALIAVFGHRIPIHFYIFPTAGKAALIQSFRAPPLIITGWYDWTLRDSFVTWELLMREAREEIRSQVRLIITPAAHNVPGYHEGIEDHPELQHNHRTQNIVELLLHWYKAVREATLDSWPTVIYYLMGANEWRVASNWPVPEAHQCALYLGSSATLTPKAPSAPSDPDHYTYDPNDPTPTVGGSIVSSVYPPGSVDVSEVQQRPDVLAYSTAPLEEDIDVVGPLRLVLYASSSAVDTDFAARLSDVFPDGRAIQLQNVVLRTRYRDPEGPPAHLEPGRIYKLDIDLWATANRFKAGHRLRLDISSADFPKFERNTNRGGESGDPLPARQMIYLDPQHPSHLLVSVLGNSPLPDVDTAKRHE